MLNFFRQIYLRSFFYDKKIEEIKIKLKEEIQSGLEKDEIFNEEERIDYINDFLESIIQKSKKKNINIKKGKLLN